MSVAIQKARRTIRERGISGFADQAGRRMVTAVEAYLALRRRPQFDDPNNLLDYANEAFGRLMHPLQVRSEIRALLDVIRIRKPRTVLEIGTANGGTLFLWTRVVSRDAHLISIDLPGGKHGGGYASWRIPIYRSFAVGSQRIDLLRGNSHDSSTFLKTKNLLNGRPVDFLFVDAGHTYSDVKQDFENYSSLVSEDGIIAFHDIAHHSPESMCEVDRLWAELKPRYDCSEFIERPDQGWGGIGYLRWKNPLRTDPSGQ
jgi:predicted O-methyltransferase YrrM